MKNLERSYNQQSKHESTMGMSSRYTEPDSIDNWRHTRILNLTKALVEALPEAKWLTVGDGRYGSDAGYLTQKGVDVIATSLTDESLRIAYENGYIKKYQAMNAENIALPEDSVDFVLCKESYHHCPRPPIALYEMLRVARIGVVLIEPLDNMKLLDFFKNMLKKLLRGDSDDDLQFEPSGNFLYRLDLRELSKMMTAMGNEVIAFKGINDFYHPRFNTGNVKMANLSFSMTKLGIAVQNILVKLGLLGYGLGAAVVFKSYPPTNVIESLKNDGFKIIVLPKNPYLKIEAK